jgi:2,5-diamino-6-(ribosylamino)-4(3H)-pyrimidinone 5'-phosphate reductase
LLAVVDGRGRVQEWQALRDAGHWSEVLALYCEATPPRREGHPVSELVLGTDRVDLRAALAAIGQRPGVELVRVDSGGALIGALLGHELIDEVSLLVHPHWTGNSDHLWYGAATSHPAAMELVDCRALGSLVWLRYRFTR